VVVGVLLMGLSAWSRGRDWTLFAEGHGCEWSVSVTSGVVQVEFIDGNWSAINVYPDRSPPSTGPWVWSSSFHRVQEEHRWWGWKWFRSVWLKTSNTFAAVPLWVIAVSAFGGGALLVRAGLRARVVAGRCVRCGYDLRGLEVEAKCPECGKGGRETGT
jgi:hypothetical protein